MEKVMNIMKETGKKVVNFLLGLVKKTAETTTCLLGKATGKVTGCLCAKAKEAVSAHRQGLLLGAAICSGVIAVASCVGYLLGKRN